MLLVSGSSASGDARDPFLPVLSPELPTDVADLAIADAQMHVNVHAWQTFFGLMWPADPGRRGKAMLGSPPDPMQQTVWETFKEQYEVYPSDGSAPASWNSPQPIPPGCSVPSAGHPVAKILYRTQKVDDVLDAIAQAVKADGTLPGTLTDLNGNVVHYEIRLNEVVYDYIVQNGLYNGPKQATRKNISYPDGSIIVKAAWKELVGSELRYADQRFLTRNTCICKDETHQQCRSAISGLVGFHVMHKTPSAPQWIWSTFEHVANTSSTDGIPASFNNPDCSGPHCTPNSQTQTGTPNQVTQILPIPEELRMLNARVQQHVTTTPSKVLSNYQLMSAQWPTSQPQPGQVTAFTVEPVFSANTTMETFAQNTSSCMGCHVMSRSLNPNEFVSGDFTFTLNNASPKPAGATCGEYQYSNSVFCSEDVILFDPNRLHKLPENRARKIKRGHRLVTNTYEMLPDYVGNKLHCSSCHLFAGGDPDASWWVGMSDAYGTTENLEDRINRCFAHSMNGKHLCQPGDECESNDEMNDIIAYMDWLTAEYEQQQGCKLGTCGSPTPRGFPGLSVDVTGDMNRGLAIYLQKCAFCHDDKGQGRYESDTYFRPALWGPDSYNQDAGFGRPRLLAQFLRWNMPFTSGGLLTDQEAQDLACFIYAQPRPGKENAGNEDTQVCSSTP